VVPNWILTYNLTLIDGTVIPDVQPTRASERAHHRCQVMEEEAAPGSPTARGSSSHKGSLSGHGPDERFRSLASSVASHLVAGVWTRCPRRLPDVTCASGLVLAENRCPVLEPGVGR
jgi:hypothetical protein